MVNNAAPVSLAHVAITPKRVHLSRLLALWRSAGWPCHDTVELDLVAAGWVTLHRDEQSRCSVQLTTAGIATLADIPEPFGVWWLHGPVDGGTLQQARPARHSACTLPLAVWMAMAQATPFAPSLWDDDATPQAPLQADRQGADKAAP
jgi:hypothetical protein